MTDKRDDLDQILHTHYLCIACRPAACHDCRTNWPCLVYRIARRANTAELANEFFLDALDRIGRQRNQP